MVSPRGWQRAASHIPRGRERGSYLVAGSEWKAGVVIWEEEGKKEKRERKSQREKERKEGREGGQKGEWEGERKERKEKGREGGREGRIILQMGQNMKFYISFFELPFLKKIYQATM